MSDATPTDHLMELARIDLNPSHRQPSGVRVVVATIVSLAGSLLADAVIVTIGTRIFHRRRVMSTFDSPTTAS